MPEMFFDGDIPASKSLFNRALIVQSHNPKIDVQGESESDDVQLMRSACLHLNSQTSFDCGHAGTVLRFLAFRISRKKGLFLLKGSERLFSRPQDELVKLLSQLGSDVELTKDSMQIFTDDWRVRGDGIFVDGTKSSQYASGILLNAWNLPTDFFFQYDKNRVSEAYFRMTLELVKSFGMQVQHSGNEFMIPAHQMPNTMSYRVEADLSSAFSVVALAPAMGDVRIQNFPMTSLQPDIFFLACLQEMQIPFSLDEQGLVVKACEEFQGLEVNLNNSPDLFPVLATLCAFASSPSYITGIEHLKYKESDRLSKTSELLKLIGIDTELKDGVFRIQPGPIDKKNIKFNTDQDHRMLMAAGVANAYGANVEVDHLDVVNKSFPEYKSLWALITLKRA